MDLRTWPGVSGRRPRWRRTAAVAAVAALALVGTACGGGDEPSPEPTGAADTSLLGPRQPASGTPIKVGLLSDGQSAAIDNKIQVDAGQALTKFLNEYRGGLGGRPIDLVSCESHADPGLAADCASKLIQADVQVVVLGEATALRDAWQPLHDAGIPIFVYGTTETAALLDRESTFVMVSQIAAFIDQPITVARENNLKKVTAVVIDVPTATSFLQSVGKQMYADLGMEVEQVAIPPGTADMTPQMAKIAAGGPTSVHIVGNDSFCIAALKGLRDVNFTGPISTLNGCVTDSTRTAVGDYLEGVYMSSPLPLGDAKDPGLGQWEAIVKTYADGKIDLSNSMGPTMYMTMLAMRNALEGITGDITSATIAEKIRTMPEMAVPGGGGLKFQCNGQAYGLTPAVCTRGTLLTRLDAKGQPTLPYRPIDSLTPRGN
ncbi:ABC transporter substrate-binding protein [Frankia sp. CNm7]|uniref:ABC transporter substrate-binding protein n=1 Tax=Frankia nepalensis TaxID=1836974 RepID=A0A937R4E8_9ACTN|nr:ABC transporter substrate-binding protein [Frankia nepalensis]MBL7502243.1 ABC transporter substrate-binding protein [Frankia nepalensis]MBL7515046.1 ABC transporter substrate-binding protein [Frankia nepalensis]MBL7518010.1 ABC transporter substrate-binding protein [Frankia nepalensis]MBL7625593.1 ABC transporter substrate-binding protein [Frankia nepalensis]